MEFRLSSSAFSSGEPIPDKYTCKGENISPPLEWINPPTDVKSFILIAEDIDAQYGWIHWVIYNIAPETSALQENLPKDYELDNHACQGFTDFREIGYTGPCKPTGEHRYYFRLYAIDTVLKSHLNMTKEDIMRQIRGHVLATAEYMGTFKL